MMPRPPAWLAWGLFGLWLAGINITSMLPGEEVDKVMLFEGFDKLLHVGVFFAGGVLLFVALMVTRRLRMSRWRAAVLVVLALGVFAVFDEQRQTGVPGREGANPGDLAANWLGIVASAVCGVAAYERVFRSAAS